MRFVRLDCPCHDPRIGGVRQGFPAVSPRRDDGWGRASRRGSRTSLKGQQLVGRCGDEGMYAGVVVLFDDPRDAPEIPEDPPGLAVSRRPRHAAVALRVSGSAQGDRSGGSGGHPPATATRRCRVRGFAGLLRDCHTEEYAILGRTDVTVTRPSMAHADQRRLQHPPNSAAASRGTSIPNWISCHVVGWNPQKYFPYKSGFWSLETTPQLTDVGCESCHGPGSRHVKAENGDLGRGR